MEKIKVLVKEPNTKFYEKKISDKFWDIYGLIYYPYEIINLYDNFFMIYSKYAREEKEKIFEPNFLLDDIGIYGISMIFKMNNNKLFSLEKEEIEEIKKCLV